MGKYFGSKATSGLCQPIFVMRPRYRSIEIKLDLLRFFAGSPISGVQATVMGAVTGVAVRDDKLSFNLSFEDGSFGTVHYLGNGHKVLPQGAA